VHLGDPILAIAIFLFGLAFGSFLNVCIYRLPLRAFTDEELAERGVERKNLSVVSPGSACPHCKTPIRFYDNVPVLSWLVLGGRCRQCHARITPRYLVVELLTALLFLACYARFGPSWFTLKFCVFCFLLLGLIFSDAETKLLPDGLTLSGLGLGLAFSLLVPVDGLVDILLQRFSLPVVDEIGWRLFSLLAALAGAAAGALFIFVVGALWTRVVGQEAMGLGDVKLLALIGAFLGLKLTGFTIFAASLLGTVVSLGVVAVVSLVRLPAALSPHPGRKKSALPRTWQVLAETYQRYREVPFGVFLGTAAVFAAFFGDALIQRYLATLGLSW